MRRNQNHLASHGCGPDVRSHNLFTRVSGTTMSKSLRSHQFSALGCVLLTCMLTFLGGSNARAQTVLADTPVYSSSNVPANLMLALSVEFPTGTVAAYTSASYTTYSVANPYLGYFDPAKCYDYSISSGFPGSATAGYFVPIGTVNSSGSCVGSGSGGATTSHWSGNMLNWATMTALDEFRQALTGGNRIVDNDDSTALTVLQRSNLNSQSNVGNFPNKAISSATTAASLIGDTNYSGLANVFLKSFGLGTTFVIANNSGFLNTGTTSTGSGKSKVTFNNIATTYNAEVQVCVAGLLESNCNAAHKTTDYVGAGVYKKPDGLIQQNYTKIRVGASAYSFLNGQTQPNGVVRALLHDNGPSSYNGYGTRITPNAYAEWSATTGKFISNPDASDSSFGTAPGGAAFTNSGTINYLNQFGYANGYETNDTLSELYWATLAYYMQQTLDSSYTTGLSTSNSADTAFPVFTGIPGSAATPTTKATVNDPIQFRCQSNAILAIGDIHTHFDTSVPSSDTPATYSGHPNLPALAVTGLTAVDAGKYTDMLGTLPLIEKQGTTAASKTMDQYLGLTTSGLGSKLEVSDTGTATYNMAGLAYYAHVNNIRTDSTGNNPYGKVTTYVVDVLEPGSYDGTSGNEIYNPTKLSSGPGPSMYWLAAKYGGFDDINNDGKPASILTWHTNTSTAAALNLRPDNYFPGNQPTLIQSGLQQIFNNVASTASQSASAPGVTPTRVLSNVTPSVAPFFSPVAGFPVYTTQYTPVSWTGDVSGYVASDAPGAALTTATGSIPWHAQIQLDTLTQSVSGTTVVGWDTGRRIVTWNGTKGVPFRYSTTNLSTAEQTALGSVTTGGTPTNLVNYLRGDKSNETTFYHARSHIMGDIVDSQAVLVQGASSPSYTETANPGYTKFSTTVANRQPVVYVGGNDGMLHAFEADFLTPTTANPVTGGGSELFAYVPSLVYAGPTGTPLINGLPALANLNGVSTNNYSHHFYVDQTPQVSDIDFTLTGDGSTTPTSTAGTSNWHSLLVGGLGKGGMGYYALDITSVPAAVATTGSAAAETTEAGNVRWEFTDPDMGYSYGAPLIVKTRKYGWVVVMTSGYDNIGAGQDGHGVLYIVNAATGKFIQKIDTGVGTVGNPAGLTQATAYTQNVGDGTIDQVYAGDLLGNVWRFDLSETALDTSGMPTPAYPAPTLLATLKDPSNNPQPITTAPRIELSIDSTGLGTLRWVFVGTGQFLDISDLNTTQQQTMYALRDGTGPAPLTTGLPLTRSVLTANTNLLTGLNLTDSSPGWYYDLNGTAGPGGGTERIVVNPDAAAGVFDVAWTTLTPSTDPCSLQGSVYATNFAGQSVVLGSNSTTLTTSLPTGSATTGLQIVQLPNGQYAVLYGQTGALPQSAAIQQPGSSSQINRVNWREILN
jgi:type IV pilus assembly protein PilY1